MLHGVHKGRRRRVIRKSVDESPLLVKSEEVNLLLRLLRQDDFVYADTVGTHVFHAKVSPSNLPSQGLMRKLGTIPNGVKPHPGFSEEIAQMMEELDTPQPENIHALAEEFCTTPRQLRSHVLVLRVDVE